MEEKPTETAMTTSNRKLELMIIDNDPIACLIQKIKIQKRFKQPLHEFEDAREAFHFIAGTEGINFVILLDIDMPSMDGWEFLTELQKTGSASLIKVIMLSCSISNVDKERSRSYPEVVDYFEKPLYDSHLDSVERVIKSFQNSTS